MQCPIPLDRLAEHVPEIETARSYASFQSEYGISLDSWLRDNQDAAQSMLNDWWQQRTTKDRLQWLTTYRDELNGRKCWLNLKLNEINKLIGEGEG